MLRGPSPDWAGGESRACAARRGPGRPQRGAVLGASLGTAEPDLGGRQFSPAEGQPAGGARSRLGSGFPGTGTATAPGAGGGTSQGPPVPQPPALCPSAFQVRIRSPTPAFPAARDRALGFNPRAGHRETLRGRCVPRGQVRVCAVPPQPSLTAAFLPNAEGSPQSRSHPFLQASTACAVAPVARRPASHHPKAGCRWLLCFW